MLRRNKQHRTLQLESFLTEVKEHLHETQSSGSVEIAEDFTYVAPLSRERWDRYPRLFTLRNHESAHIPRTVSHYRGPRWSREGRELCIGLIYSNLVGVMTINQEEE